MLLKLIYFWH